METQKVKISKIIVDDEIQSRTGLNEQYIKEYHEEIELGSQFPPVELFFDGQYYFLTDGFHRHQAFKKAGKKTIPAIIHEGGHREAILHSVGVNANHGIRRTNEDKQRAVHKLLDDDDWCLWSDGEIAKRCAVSQPFVSKLRRESTQNGSESPPQRKGADGRIINTSNIGKEPKSSEEQASVAANETSPEGIDKTQGETAEVEVDFSNKTDPPKSKKTSKSSSDKDADDKDEGGEDGEEETADLLPKVKQSITDLFSGLTEINKILPKKGIVSKAALKRLEKPLQELKTTWTQFISDITEMIEN